jgi:hypothetical protein
MHACARASGARRGRRAQRGPCALYTPLARRARARAASPSSPPHVPRLKPHVPRRPASPQSPWPHEGGLLKCFLRREQLSSGLAGLGTKRYRFTLWHGVDAGAKDARFLLCAMQHSK